MSRTSYIPSSLQVQPYQFDSFSMLSEYSQGAFPIWVGVELALRSAFGGAVRCNSEIEKSDGFPPISLNGGFQCLHSFLFLPTSSSTFFYKFLHFSHFQNDNTSTEEHSNSLENLQRAIQRRLDIQKRVPRTNSKGITSILQEVERRIRIALSCEQNQLYSFFSAGATLPVRIFFHAFCIFPRGWGRTRFVLHLLFICPSSNSFMFVTFGSSKTLTTTKKRIRKRN